MNFEKHLNLKNTLALMIITAFLYLLFEMEIFGEIITINVIIPLVALSYVLTGFFISMVIYKQKHCIFKVIGSLLVYCFIFLNSSIAILSNKQSTANIFIFLFLITTLIGTLILLIYMSQNKIIISLHLIIIYLLILILGGFIIATYKITFLGESAKDLITIIEKGLCNFFTFPKNPKSIILISQFFLGKFLDAIALGFVASIIIEKLKSLNSN